MSRIVTFGEIMARLATPGFKRFQQTMPGTLEVTFAGAEASIAASIAYLGGDASFATALPDNGLADACVADLRSMGVCTRNILRTAGGRLGLYFLETGANQRPGVVIYDREGSFVAITPPSTYDWSAIFEGAEWFVISGITPAISRNATEVTRTALREASARGIKVACDMNYRRKLWQWDPTHEPRALATRMMRELMPLVDLFIGGREDASEILGIPDAGSSADALASVAQQIAAMYPRIRHVAMTRRENHSATADSSMMRSRIQRALHPCEPVSPHFTRSQPSWIASVLATLSPPHCFSPSPHQCSALQGPQSLSRPPPAASHTRSKATSTTSPAMKSKRSCTVIPRAG